MTTDTPYEDTSSLDDFINTPTTPVEAPVAKEPPVEPTETVEDAPEAVETDDTTEAVEEKKGRSTADRIKKLTAEKKAAERAAAEVVSLRAEIEALKKAATPSALTETPKTDNNTASGAPDPAKYQYGELDPQFMRDTAKFEAQALISEFRESQRRESEATQQADAAQREAAALREKAESINKAGVAKFNDFEEVVVEAAKRGEYTLTKEMFELATETDAPADVLYHLASNPDEAELVASLPYAKQALWFGKMQAKFAAPPPAKVPKAPPPLATPTRGSGGRYEVPDDTDDLAAFERKFFQRG
jgi:hypothetical protein